MAISTLGAEFPIIQATGGTITEITVGQYRYRVHTFTSTGVLDIVVTGNASAFSRPLIEYVVVAGGGAGGGLYTGAEAAGGGGAGGYISSVIGEMSGGGVPAVGPLPAITQTLTVTIGAGGASTILFPAQMPGGNGSNSSLGSNIVAVGGGGGGSVDTVWVHRNGQRGGSAGGNGARRNDQFSWDNSTYPSGGRDVPFIRNEGTYGQGFDGGKSGYAGGGGGGAGGAGGTVLQDNFAVGGAGGIGVASNINGTLTYRAGGGGGGMYGNTGNFPGAGGLGGGGDGGQWVSPFTTTSGTAGVAGSANTGGGGGGNAGYSSTSVSATGGSGIVIVRYPIGLA